jgi:hypothetical protein
MCPATPRSGRPRHQTDHLRMLTGTTRSREIDYLSCLLAARAMRNIATSTTARNAASKINQFVGFAIKRTLLTVALKCPPLLANSTSP